MRVVSWNIEMGRGVDEAASHLTANTDLRDADIVLLQEMDPVSTRELADLIGMDSRYTAAAAHTRTGLPFGNAVLSRWPMSAAVEVPLPHVARIQGQPRSATATTVEVDGRPILTYSVHLETVLLRLHRRVHQVRTVASHAETPSTVPVVVGGDFNSASQRSRRAFDHQMGVAGMTRVSSHQATTFERFGRSFTLDHLYARGLRATRTGVVGNVTASDHLPIWSHLEAL